MHWNDPATVCHIHTKDYSQILPRNCKYSYDYYGHLHPRPARLYWHIPRARTAHMIGDFIMPSFFQGLIQFGRNLIQCLVPGNLLHSPPPLLPFRFSGKRIAIRICDLIDCRRPLCTIPSSTAGMIWIAFNFLISFVSLST